MGNQNAPEEEQEKNDPPTVITVPEKYKDPITKKIMKHPIMVLSSMSVYDNVTIQRWMESKRAFDPLTGIPMAHGKWMTLLEQRPDIKSKIDEFIKANPSFKSDILNENDKSIEWESLFKSYDQKITQKHQQILDDQSSLRVKAKQLFKPSDDIKKADIDDINVEYDESIVLRSDIPIICIMGPSRNGKSTIVNDILGVKQATETSPNPNVAHTKGGWVAKYESNPKDYETPVHVYRFEDTNDDFKKGEVQNVTDNIGQNENETKDKGDEGDEFYILDMEGLSHDVTKFTKRLFYACYATANVIVWNDKEVASDRFKNLMKKLKHEMKAVATSDNKPSFLYLKRDAEDCVCTPYNTLDEYMNNHESLKWFREMNIFSSISAYQLNRPSLDKNNANLPFNFHSDEKNRQLLTPLIKKLISLSKNSKRFACNMYKLKQQISHINKATALSMTKELIMNNKILQNFLLPPKGDPRRRRDMIYVACEFNWDHQDLAKKFNEEMKKMQTLLSNAAEKNEKILAELEENKNEIYERTKNKVVNDKFALPIAIGATGLSIGAVILVGAATGGTGAGVIAAAYAVIATTGSAAFITYQWMNGNFIMYALGQTEQEWKDDNERVTSKTPIAYWGGDIDFYIQ